MNKLEKSLIPSVLRQKLQNFLEKKKSSQTAPARLVRAGLGSARARAFSSRVKLESSPTTYAFSLLLLLLFSPFPPHLHFFFPTQNRGGNTIFRHSEGKQRMRPQKDFLLVCPAASREHSSGGGQMLALSVMPSPGSKNMTNRGVKILWCKMIWKGLKQSMLKRQTLPEPL